MRIRNSFCLFLAVVFFLTNCVKEMDNEVHTYDCFYATVEGEGGDDVTKAYFAKSSATSGNHAVKWNDNDKIGIISDEQKSPLEFNGNSSGVFTRDGGINGSNLIAFYPYPTNYNSNTKVVKFGSIAPAFDEKSISMPMVATRNGNTLNFKQTCGVLHFFIKGTGSYSKISLKSNNKTAIYGPGEVDVSSNANLDKPVFNLSSSSSSSDEIVANVPKEGLDWNKGVDVYFVLPPIPLNNGFTLTVTTTTDNKQLTKSKTGSVSIARGKMTRYELNLDDLNNDKPKPQAVDLGLSVMWATFNVGATKPEEYGDYFAWGETEPKENYNWSTYKWCGGEEKTLTKYNKSISYGEVDGKTELDQEDDAAFVHWGGNWHMPTKSQQIELFDKSNCKWEWTDNYNGTGVKGFVVTSKKSGFTKNSIFLPATGYRYDSTLDNYGSTGHFWSSSLSSSDQDKARALAFLSPKNYGWEDSYRYYGFTIRPVYSEPVASVSVKPTALSMHVGESATLTATVIPENASNKSVTWSSSDSKIVSVINKDSGEIKAISTGTAVITAKTTDGGMTADCTVTVKMAVPDMVDLGLSVKWGSFNVGATKPGEVGSYFSWGELTPKSNYDWSSYSLCDGTQSSINKYTKTDGYTVLDASDDAAAYNLEGSWRMPTKVEMEELLNNCSWVLTTQDGADGYLVTSNIPGYKNKSIFLPVTGRYNGSNKYGSSTDGKYWSATRHSDWQDSAYTIDFDDDNHYSVSYSDRCLGLAIRPVYGEPSFVDLGLSVKWATFNVGASKPEESGDYFAWGEIEPYYQSGNAQSSSPVWKTGKTSGYNWASYKWCNGDWNKLTKYCTQSSYWDSSAPMDNKTVLDLDDDVARANWGGNWRMPTYAEWKELINKCTWTGTTQNGVNGGLVTGSNGNSIFLPAAGYRIDSYLYDVGSLGFYWSSSLSTDGPDFAGSVYFNSGNVYKYHNLRCYGQSVRPVTE